jgi:hypothetical protein
MKSTYRIPIRETREYHVIVEVEADSIREAIEFAEAGETLSESAGTLQDITDRVIIGQPTLVKTP